MDSEITLNPEQGLYVIPCRNAAGKVTGYTCLGFDVCTKWGGQTLAWLEREAMPEITFNPADSLRARWEASKPATLERYAVYSDIMAAGSAFSVKSGKRDESELTPALRGLEGKRVEVTEPGERPRRFWVGKSTGWRPCHLEIKTRRSFGGCAAYLSEGATVRVVDSGPR